MLEVMLLYYPVIATGLTLLVDVGVSCHAVLYKRDTRAAIAWVGFIWFVPVVGAILYLLFGINRIERRARQLRGRRPQPGSIPVGCSLADGLDRALDPGVGHLRTLAKLVGDVTHRPLLSGNRVTPLVNEAAYTNMLQAIHEAGSSISLTTYIFDNDPAGQLFLEALSSAVARRVEVRVIVDDVGARYTWPSIVRPLRRAGIPVARFLPKLIPWAFPYANLRNHRKIMVVDGRVGFTGGMNIREGHSAELKPRHPVDDVHFRVEGPVVTQLQEVFVDDWAFCTGEPLAGDRWFPPSAEAGAVFARGISDGPDDDFEKLRTTILGALACAQSSVTIVTPYFLPDSGLITALNITALRGVQVDILLPQVNNLRLVQWASTALLWQVLERGCRVWLSPPPFDHTKLMVVDGTWSLLGSANWDPRSLRLNFEFNLECYDRELAAGLERLIQLKLRRAKCLTLNDLDGRGLPFKLRDGVARLFSPYL
jgi:cardiolipin synthase